MQTPEDEAAQRKRVNASLAKIRRAEREHNERQRELMVGGGVGPGPDGMWSRMEPVEWHVGANDQDIPLRWFVIGFVVLLVGMAWMLSLA